MSQASLPPEAPLDTPYRQPRLSDDAAFYGHYAPSRARVTLLLSYALAHEKHPFWAAVGRRLTRGHGSPPWNEVIAAAHEAGVEWGAHARERRVAHAILYEGRVPGRRGEPVEPFDEKAAAHAQDHL